MVAIGYSKRKASRNPIDTQRSLRSSAARHRVRKNASLRACVRRAREIPKSEMAVQEVHERLDSSTNLAKSSPICRVCDLTLYCCKPGRSMGEAGESAYPPTCATAIEATAATRLAAKARLPCGPGYVWLWSTQGGAR